MIITEDIRCRIQYYQYDTKQYVDFYGKYLDRSHIISATVQRQCCPDGGFEIGGAYAATLAMELHLPGMTTFQVRGAKVIVESKYGHEADWYRMGVFWVTDASRTGEIFSINGQDAIGWLDTSCYNNDSAADSFGKVLMEKYLAEGKPPDTYANESGWAYALTYETNRFILFQTGIPNMLSWKSWSSCTGNDAHYCNSHFWVETPEGSGIYTESDMQTTIFCMAAPEGADSETPRDLYQMLAAYTGGFIYADRDGALTLGQFGADHLGTAEIGQDEIEYQTCEIAGAELYPNRILARAEHSDGESSAWNYVPDPDYSQYIYFNIVLESNLFIDWIARSTTSRSTYLGSIARGIRKLFQGYQDGAGYTHGRLHIRPFSCTVHSEKRFMPGQRIRIAHRELHESSQTVYDSLVTSVTWRYRGGYQLACGGGDSRSMADCLRQSKGDKAKKTALLRCRAIEKRVTELGG